MNYNNKVYASTKRSTKWSQATKQERDFYQNYQATTQRRPSVLLGDRLLIGKYTGNPLHSIPKAHLQLLIDTYQITNKDDKTYIQNYLKATQ